MNILNKYKNLLINIGLFTLNTVSTKLITFTRAVVHFFLTASQYGITDMSMTVANLAAPVITLSIGNAATRYIIDDPLNEKHYISVGFGLLYSAVYLCFFVAAFRFSSVWRTWRI